MRREGAAALVLSAAAGCSYLIGVSGDATLLPAEGDASDAGHAQDGLAPVLDAGLAMPDADGMSPFSSPGVIACAGGTCAVPDNACCHPPEAGAACQPESTPCAGPERVCDETEDCPEGEVCCVVEVRTTAFGTACREACDPGQPRACARPSECDGRPCVEIACAGTRVRTCNGEGAEAGCK